MRSGRAGAGCGSGTGDDLGAHPRDPPLAADLAAAVAPAGVDPTADRHAVEDALPRAIADRGGYVDWDFDDRGWVVYLLAPEREAFRGKTVPEALAWCLVWVMGTTGEIGVVG